MSFRRGLRVPTLTPGLAAPFRPREEAAGPGGPTPSPTGLLSAFRSDRPFVAIDFETADRWPDSACAVGLVRVVGDHVVAREVRLIRPPRSFIEHTAVHGIAWVDVAGKPAFAEIWPQVSGMLEGVAFVAAHNARFDQGVLRACCLAAGMQPPDIPFLCTVQLARRTWNLRPNRLPDVCR
ncbi:MAG: hypothetical protein FJ315_01955, partial [SAR202 cluster bacterium]|nr:hypothetical protein [SAR202 cluster bacterium]